MLRFIVGYSAFGFGDRPNTVKVYNLVQDIWYNRANIYEYQDNNERQTNN